jgi:hypothetical protein
MKKSTRKRIQTLLQTSAKYFEEAVRIAREEPGWSKAFGFAAGEPTGLFLNVIRSYEDRDATNGSPPEEACVAGPSKASNCDCGAW